MKRLSFRITLVIAMLFASIRITAQDLVTGVNGIPVSTAGHLPNKMYYNILSEEEKTIELAGVDIRGEWQRVQIPDSVQGYKVVAIGDTVFFDTFVDSLLIPNTVKSIGKYAFSYGLFIYIHLPDSIEEIQDGTFYNCGCGTLILPNSIKSIGNGAFAGFTYFNSIDASAHYDFLPNTIKHIGNRAFMGSNIGYLNLSDSLLTIGDAAFKGSNLVNIIIPKSVVSIGSKAFEECKYLRSVNITSERLTCIKKKTFARTGRLGWANKIQLPPQIKVIEDSAFYDGCITLNMSWDSIESVGKFAFKTYENFRPLNDTVNLPASLTHIGKGAFLQQPTYFNVDKDNPTYASSHGNIYSKDFSTLIYGWRYNCDDEIDSIKISTIAPYAISTDSTAHWDYMHIPQSVTLIKEDAFSDVNIDRLYCHASTPPVCEENALKYTYKYLELAQDGKRWYVKTKNTTLYVPIGCKTIYETTAPWCDFKEIIEFKEPTTIKEVQENQLHISVQNGTIIIDGMEALATPIMIYNLNGQRVYNGYDTTVGNLPKGTYIIRIADKTYKIVL